MKLPHVVILAASIYAFAPNAIAEPIRIGVPVALTGTGASFGVDMKNAMELANDTLGSGRYKLFYDDEKCYGKDAVTVARKFIDLDKISYALGFSCNAGLLPVASIYERAGIPVITSAATSGDVEDIGKNIFRLFPADQDAAKMLFRYMAPRHKKIGILTEVNEYNELLERTVRNLNAASSEPRELFTETFQSDEPDLRPSLLRLHSKGVDAIFFNTVGENTFIRAIQQLRAIPFHGKRYTVYYGASPVVLDSVGADIEGMEFANLPLLDEFSSEESKKVIEMYRKRFGEVQTNPVLILTVFESFRILDLAIRSGKPVGEYLANTKFDGGPLGKFSFDKHGAVEGIGFSMQRVVGKKAVRIGEEASQ